MQSPSLERRLHWLALSTNLKGNAATAAQSDTREPNAQSRKEAAVAVAAAEAEAVEAVEETAAVVAVAEATRHATAVERKGTKKRIAGRSIPTRRQNGSSPARQLEARWRSW